MNHCRLVDTLSSKELINQFDRQECFILISIRFNYLILNYEFLLLFCTASHTCIMGIVYGLPFSSLGVFRAYSMPGRPQLFGFILEFAWTK